MKSAVRYQGILYRAINPIWAREPLSGAGAKLNGGRFNPKGVEALYTAVTTKTALLETSRAGGLQPTTLVSYDADIEPVFDATQAENLTAYGLDLQAPAVKNWIIHMRGGRKAPAQLFAERLISEGYAGMRVQSLAKGASAEDINIVLWAWGSNLPARLTLIDDEKRLQRLASGDISA